MVFLFKRSYPTRATEDTNKSGTAGKSKSLFTKGSTVSYPMAKVEIPRVDEPSNISFALVSKGTFSIFSKIRIRFCLSRGRKERVPTSRPNPFTLFIYSAIRIPS